MKTLKTVGGGGAHKQRAEKPTGPGVKAREWPLVRPTAHACDSLDSGRDGRVEKKETGQRA